MGLQIRIRHALGQRVIELPERTAEDPIVVGRSGSALVQIPSVTVAPRHCVLFVHEGHWAVQELQTGTILINGQPVDGASLLQIGDVIQIGQDAGATIEVDPGAAAQGHTGYAGVFAEGMSAAASHPQASVPYAPPAYSPPASAGARGAPAAAPQYAAPQPAYGDYASADDQISFTPSAPSTYSSYRRPARSGNGGMIAVMVIAVVLIGSVVAYVIYREKSKPPVAQKPPEVIIVKAPAAPKKVEVFEGLGTADTAIDKMDKTGRIPGSKPAAATPSGVKPAGSATIDPRANPDASSTPAASDRPQRPLESATVRPGEVSPETPAKPETPVDSAKKPAAGGSDEPAMDPVRRPAATDESDPPMDPVRKPAAPAGPDAETLDPAMAASWEGMKQLAEMPGKESFAILRFEDFRRLNPGKYDKELDEFIDQKMDRIWWERIDQLFRRIETLNEAAKKTQLEIFDENNPDVKKQKIEAMNDMKKDLELANKTLRETMGYAETNPPNLNSSAELASLAQKRDKLKYEGWKKATLFFIKSNQGRLQWANEG